MGSSSRVHPSSLPGSFEIVTRPRKILAVRKEYRERLIDFGILDLERALQGHPSDIRLRAGRADHVSVPIPGHPHQRIFIRQYRHGGFLRGLLRGSFIPKSRPFQEIRVSEGARAGGIATPEVLACVGTRGLVFHRWSIVQEDLHGCIDLVHFFLRAGRRAGSCEWARRRRVIAAAARSIRRLHDIGIRHADLHLKNLMIREGEEDVTIIVDLDKSTRHSSLSMRERTRNLARLDRSVEKLNLKGAGITRTERLRFFRDYWGEDCPSRSDIRAMLRRQRRSLRFHRWLWDSGNALAGKTAETPEPIGFRP